MRTAGYRRIPGASECQKCGLVAGVVIGYVDEENGVRIARAAWCCPRCVNRAVERIEQLEALIRAMNQAGRNPAAHDQEKPR